MQTKEIYTVICQKVLSVRQKTKLRVWTEGMGTLCPMGPNDWLAPLRVTEHSPVVIGPDLSKIHFTFTSTQTWIFIPHSC